MTIKKTQYWENCMHIIGKDILKFHAIYWPAMLMAANLPLPKQFLPMVGGQMKEKISKSTGNTIDSNEIIERFGLDQFRFFLLREVTLGKDGDFFNKSSFKNRINADLSNNLGNLVQRTLKFLF